MRSRLLCSISLAPPKINNGLTERSAHFVLMRVDRTLGMEKSLPLLRGEHMRRSGPELFTHAERSSPHDEYRNFCILVHYAIRNAAEHSRFKGAFTMGPHNNQVNF